MHKLISRRRAALWAALAVVVGLLAMPHHLAAAETPGASEPPSPVDEYTKRVEEFRKAAPDLSKKIEDSAKAIQDLTDVEQARKEIEQLRAIVGDLLGRVSDNGDIAQLGTKALAHSRQKLAALEQETRFKPEEKQFLTEQWRRLVGETERAAGDLDTARREFADLLRSLQTREDFIDELVQVRRAGEAVTVLRQLAKDIRDAKAKLDTLINGIKPPGV